MRLLPLLEHLKPTTELDHHRLPLPSTVRENCLKLSLFLLLIMEKLCSRGSELIGLQINFKVFVTFFFWILLILVWCCLEVVFFVNCGINLVLIQVIGLTILLISHVVEQVMVRTGAMFILAWLVSR